MEIKNNSAGALSIPALITVTFFAMIELTIRRFFNRQIELIISKSYNNIFLVSLFATNHNNLISNNSSRSLIIRSYFYD